MTTASSRANSSASGRRGAVGRGDSVACRRSAEASRNRNRAAAPYRRAGGRRLRRLRWLAEEEEGPSPLPPSLPPPLTPRGHRPRERRSGTAPRRRCLATPLLPVPPPPPEPRRNPRWKRRRGTVPRRSSGSSTIPAISGRRRISRSSTRACLSARASTTTAST